MYEWNDGYRYIMGIRDRYVEKYGLDTYSLRDMCEKLGYDDFLANVIIAVYGKRNLIKYQLVGDSDIRTNPHSIYRELRSLVVDMETKDIVLCPFRKFFNIDEVEETQMRHVRELLKSAKSVEISNKLDGSMQSARYYHGSVVMSGSLALDPEQSYRLKEGYSWITPKYESMLKDNDGCTFLFEYISVNDKHVVEYAKEQQGLYLIGIRRVCDGYQYSYKEVKRVADAYGILMTEIEMRGFDEILQARDTYQSKDKEGWVINIDGNMFKMKCDDYLKIHHILSYVSSANVIIHAIADDTFDDLISAVPEHYKERVWTIANIVFDYKKKKEQTIRSNYMKAKHASEQQAVALQAQGTELKAKLFALQVQELVPKEFRSYVFAMKNGQEINVLKSRFGKYAKFVDIAGVDASHVSVLFAKEDEDDV